MNKAETLNKQPTRSHYARAKVSNGFGLLPNTDGRTIWARRFRDLIEVHTQDRGGELACSAAEHALIRRASAIIVELEIMETRFCDQGGAKLPELEAYQRSTNTLRRLFETLGLKRGAKDITPTEKANAMPSLVELMGAGE